MRELIIKEYSLKESSEKHVTTKFFATEVIKSPSNTSLSIDDVLARTKLQNIVNTSTDVIKFEENEFKLFLELFNNSKWNYSHEDLGDFILEVKKLNESII